MKPDLPARSLARRVSRVRTRHPRRILPSRRLLILSNPIWCPNRGVAAHKTHDLSISRRKSSGSLTSYLSRAEQRSLVVPFQIAHTARWNIEWRREILEKVMLLEPMLGSRIGIGATFVHVIENRFVWDRCGSKTRACAEPLFYYA